MKNYNYFSLNNRLLTISQEVSNAKANLKSEVHSHILSYDLKLCYSLSLKQAKPILKNYTLVHKLTKLNCFN